MGLVNYYNRFLPNLANTLAPLHRLLQKNTKWCWSKECTESFTKVKDAIASDLVLTHFNPRTPLVLACDASAYGLGAVLSHTSDLGHDKPIAFASRTLSKAECNYSQIEKEALALMWGIKCFQQYLYGNHFTLITDHQRLVSILHPDKALQSVIAAWLQRYALLLSEYTFHIQYRSTHCHGNADALSRLPLTEATEVERQDREELDDFPEFRLNQLEQIPVTTAVLRDATAKDPVLSRVLEYTQVGWPVDNQKN